MSDNASCLSYSNPEETMTWEEFKTWVDKELEELGISQSVHIFYIDTHMPTRTELNDIGIGFGEDGISIAS